MTEISDASKQAKENLLPFEKINRKTLEKSSCIPTPGLGRSPYERTIPEILACGVVNVNKFDGPTSHQVVDYLKQIIDVDKAGHSGTLDPGVTGVLPVAMGRATKILETLLSAGKEYVCLMYIHKLLDENVVRDAVNSFVGKIKQLPPIKSAVKRQLRFRKIYYIEIMEIDGQYVLFKVGCQAGTYIRKLVHDIGQKLGVGAHMAQLIRTKAGPFDETSTVTLQDVADAYHYYKNENDDRFLRKLVHPIEFGVTHLPRVWISDNAVNSICHGASLNSPGVCKIESEIQIDEDVAIMTLKEELVAVGKCRMTPKDVLTKKKGTVVDNLKVIMNPDYYPKYQRLAIVDKKEEPISKKEKSTQKRV